jgi:Flp pilus assembly protein TadD
MKIRLTLLLVLALSAGACQRGRLSPVVNNSPASTPSATSSQVHESPRTVLAAAEKVGKKAENDRLAAKRKRLAAARRARSRSLASASLEAGRQLLRDSLDESALKAFREAVRLNSRSAEAWLGIAYVCERSGNVKDAIVAFKEAKKLWGM